MRIVLQVIHVLLALAYPLIVWWSLSHLSPRVVGVLVLAVLVPLLLLRLRTSDRHSCWAVLRVPLSVMVLLGLGVVFDDERFMLAMPVLISGVLLLTFAGSLFGDVSMVERFARLQEPDLSDEQRAHCRQATIAWCAFFVLNGVTAAVLAVAAPVSWWALYTGAIAYGLMGLVFATELTVRVHRFGWRAGGRWLGRLMDRRPGEEVCDGG